MSGGLGRGGRGGGGRGGRPGVDPTPGRGHRRGGGRFCAGEKEKADVNVGDCALGRRGGGSCEGVKAKGYFYLREVDPSWPSGVQGGRKREREKI